MQHAHIEIPQAQSAVLSNTAKSIVPVITTPRVEGHGGDPGLMALTSCYDGGIHHRPNRDQVVLTACENVFTIRRPAHRDETAVIGMIQVQQPEIDHVSSETC